MFLHLSVVTVWAFCFMWSHQSKYLLTTLYWNGNEVLIPWISEIRNCNSKVERRKAACVVQQKGGWSECSEQEEQQALWSGFKDVSQGLCVSWPSSHDRKSAFRHGGPILLQKTLNTHHHMFSYSPQKILKSDSRDLRCITELTADRAAVSSFPQSVTSVRKLKWDQTSQDVISPLMLTSVRG